MNGVENDAVMAWLKICCLWKLKIYSNRFNLKICTRNSPEYFSLVVADVFYFYRQFFH